MVWKVPVYGSLPVLASGFWLRSRARGWGEMDGRLPVSEAGPKLELGRGVGWSCGSLPVLASGFYLRNTGGEGGWQYGFVSSSTNVGGGVQKRLPLVGCRRWRRRARAGGGGYAPPWPVPHAARVSSPPAAFRLRAPGRPSYLSRAPGKPAAPLEGRFILIRTPRRVYS